MTTATRGVTKATKDKALSALDGMAEIVRAEMLIRGTYIDDEVSDEKRAKAGAICGGYKHCAIGSLWAGAGIRRKNLGTRKNPSFILPGVGQSERHWFMERHPGLRLALDALNQAADDYVERTGTYMPWKNRYHDSIEALFESNYGDDLTKGDLLKIITAAKRKVRAA